MTDFKPAHPPLAHFIWGGGLVDRLSISSASSGALAFCRVLENACPSTQIPLARSLGTSLCHTMGSRYHYLVNNSMMVAYQGKPVSLTSSRKTHGMTVDHVLTVYNSTSDNKNRLNM